MTVGPPRFIARWVETTTSTTRNATGPAACGASLIRRTGVFTATPGRGGLRQHGVSEGGLEPPPPTRGLAPQASASAIPPLGPAGRAYVTAHPTITGGGGRASLRFGDQVAGCAAWETERSGARPRGPVPPRTRSCSSPAS